MTLADRYGLALTTSSSAARDAYFEGCDLLLTAWPGAAAAFDRAIAADPAFALAHLAKARALQAAADMPAARAALATADSLAARLSEREASHLGVFRLLLSGQPVATLEAVRSHLQTWPRDAVVLSLAANQTGLIGLSGRVGRERELVALLESLAPHYGDDPWFGAHLAMALSENGEQARAEPIIVRSIAAQPHNAYAAHARAHLHYELAEADQAIAFMRAWLPTYSPQAILYGHLSWHLALVELQEGDDQAAFRRYADVLMAPTYGGPAAFQMMDAAAFLWRAELAGHPRDPEKWQALQDLTQIASPRPMGPLFDWHVALVQAVAGDGEALEARARAMEEMIAAGRYPAGPVLPALSRAFAAFQRQDWAAAIDLLTPILPERERIGGSRAQMDLLELTLLKAYAAASRHDELGALLAARRPGPAPLPLETLH